MSQLETHRAELVKMYFGKPEHAISEAEVIEKFYSEEELDKSSELRIRYETAKREIVEAELATLLYVLEEYLSPEAAAKFYPLREQIDEAIKAGTLSENFTPAEF